MLLYLKISRSEISVLKKSLIIVKLKVQARYSINSKIVKIQAKEMDRVISQQLIRMFDNIYESSIIQFTLLI